MCFLQLDFVLQKRSQERFKVAIQQLTDGKVISSRIHTCTHRRGEGISLISYDSTSTCVEGFTASGFSKTIGFHARTSFQLAFCSCSIETLDGVAWLSVACTQGAAFHLHHLGHCGKSGATTEKDCWKLKQLSRLSVSAELLRPLALYFGESQFKSLANIQLMFQALGSNWMLEIWIAEGEWAW